MEQEIKKPNHVSMPVEIAYSSLSLAEIGAIFIYHSLEHSGLGVLDARSQNEEFVKASKSLHEKGVLSISGGKGELNINLNLNPVLDEVESKETGE